MAGAGARVGVLNVPHTEATLVGQLELGRHTPGGQWFLRVGVGIGYPSMHYSGADLVGQLGLVWLRAWCCLSRQARVPGPCFHLY